MTNARPVMRTVANRYDVAILGTGIGGTILGAILARHGLRVLLIEEAIHPRFAIGESTVPETSFLFRLLAARYGVPEIEALASHQLMLRHIGSSHGVKRNFSFLCHRAGELQVPAESTQYSTAAPPLGPDVHMFRQDTDAWMLAVAVGYGAVVHQRTAITEVDIDGDGVRLRARDGREFVSSYVVDAGGLKSMLAQRFGLRQDPCALKTRSRTIYTHMVGVKLYDAIAGGPEAHGLPSPLSQATLHHLFDGGWMWVIPFNNHPSSTNPLVSVGLNLDVDRHPRTGRPPDEEFWSWVHAHPTVARQFAGASAIRDWTATDRMQFSSTRAVGDRFCLLPHAASFVDPLFSSGLGITMSAINVLADRLIQATADGDYSAERFAYVDVWMKANFRYYDRLVAGAYASFGNFSLWNAWVRLWMVGGILSAFGSYELLVRARRSADPRASRLCEEYPYRGLQSNELAEFATLFDRAEQELEAFKTGSRSAEDVSARIFHVVDESQLWPGPWGRLDPATRHGNTFTLHRLYRNGLWLRHRAPAGIRKYFYVTPTVRDTLGDAARDCVDQLKRSGTSLLNHLRDYVVDINTDWERLDAARSRPALAPAVAVSPPVTGHDHVRVIRAGAKP